MTAHRNRFIKVSLFERCSTNLSDAKVVGQGDDYLLLERAQPKPRVDAKKAIRKSAASKKTNAQPSPSPSSTSATATPHTLEQ